MVQIDIVPARASHLRQIAAVMRRADQEEVIAATGRSPLSALSASYRKSAICMVALVDGKAEVIFGAGDLSILTRLGAPWLLGSDAIERHRVEFLRQSVHWRGQLLRRYDVLRNVVHCQNKVSIRWLRWLGFTFSEPFKIRGHDFMMFELRADHV